MKVKVGIKKETAEGAEQSRYLVTRLAIGRQPDLPITQEDYQGLADAREVLFEASLCEEKFFAISEHFREIEEYVFKVSLDQMLYLNSWIPGVYIVGFQFSRLIAAFLSAVRLYFDSYATHAAAVSRNVLSRDIVRKTAGQEFDDSFEFRFMEALRNHVQHRGYPVWSTTFQHKKGDDDALNHSVFFYFDISEIDDPQFNARVRAEIESTGSKVELRQSIRSYFSSICKIHIEQRNILKPYRDTAEGQLKEWQNKWTNQFPNERLLGVAACKFNGAFWDKSVKAIYLELHADEYRRWLEKRTASLINMSRRRATVY